MGLIQAFEVVCETQIDGAMFLIPLVGVRGFEPPAPASRRQCSTRLSYTPKPSRKCSIEHFINQMENVSRTELHPIAFDRIIPTPLRSFP